MISGLIKYVSTEFSQALTKKSTTEGPVSMPSPKISMMIHKKTVYRPKTAYGNFFKIKELVNKSKIQNIYYFSFLKHKNKINSLENEKNLNFYKKFTKNTKKFSNISSNDSTNYKRCALIEKSRMPFENIITYGFYRATKINSTEGEKLIAMDELVNGKKDEVPPLNIINGIKINKGKKENNNNIENLKAYPHFKNSLNIFSSDSINDTIIDFVNYIQNFINNSTSDFNNYNSHLFKRKKDHIPFQKIETYSFNRDYSPLPHKKVITKKLTINLSMKNNKKKNNKREKFISKIISSSVDIMHNGQIKNEKKFSQFYLKNLLKNLSKKEHFSNKFSKFYSSDSTNYNISFLKKVRMPLQNITYGFYKSHQI